MKSNLLGAARFVPKPNPNNVGSVTRYMSLWDNELIDDVTERFALETTSDATVYPSQVSGQKLRVANKSYRAMTAHESYQIKSGRPFSIQCKFNVTNAPDAYAGGLLSVWSESDGAQNGWILAVMADRSISLQISPNGSQTTGVVLIGSPAGAVTFGTDYHVAVERDINNKITLYLNGVAVATQTSSVGSFAATTRLMVRRGWLGSVWDIQFSDAVVFGKTFVPPLKFPRLIPDLKYSQAINDSIVTQLAFRRDDPHCEVTGQPIQFSTTAQVYSGTLLAGTTLSETYNLPVPYWGAGDFTYETKFCINGTISGGGAMLPSHWFNGGATSTDNRFLCYVLQTGEIRFAINNGNGVPGSTFGSSPAGAVVVGKDYHFVVERIDGVVKGYLNGALVFTFTFAPAMWATTGNRLFNSYNGSTACRVTVWDFRIAKRALYNGVIVKPSVLPKMLVDYKKSVPNFKLRVGSLTGTTNGELRGFAKHVLYGGQPVSFGELFPQVFYHTGLQRMIRIKAIIAQNGQYVVFSCAYSNEVRQTDTPLMTNTIKLGASQWNMFAGTPPGMGNTGDVNFYYTGVGAAGALFAADEALVDFAFV